MKRCPLLQGNVLTTYRREILLVLIVKLVLVLALKYAFFNYPVRDCEYFHSL